LRRPTLKQINEVAAFYISAISGFEIASKVARGKLTLPHAPLEWFENVIEHHSLMVLSRALDVCVTAAGLPALLNCGEFRNSLAFSPLK
jgi:PIN domain nuclease of toxin-antitoxin system